MAGMGVIPQLSFGALKKLDENLLSVALWVVRERDLWSSFILFEIPTESVNGVGALELLGASTPKPSGSGA